MPIAALLGAPPCAGQTIEQRARNAAAASREGTSSSETLIGRYISPGLSGGAVTSIDGTASFVSSIACQKSATLLEVIVQPAATGDLGTVSIARDSDLDGSVDSRATLPVIVSGICANGVIACNLGTWDNCLSYRWDVDAAQALKLAQTSLGQLAGCYCINASCGSNLAWTNISTVLKDLGGGMIGALTTADPRYGVAQATIDGTAIRYTGAQTTACSTEPSLAQTAYRGSPASLSGDAVTVSSFSSVFQALKASAIGTGTSLAYRTCAIERQITVSSPAPDAIISRLSGGYSTISSGTSLDFLMGSPSDDTLAGGSCTLFDFRMTLKVGDAARISAATLAQYYADDWAQIYIDGTLVASGPTDWTTSGNPPGACERGTTFTRAPALDLKPWLTDGEHEIWLRVAVGGNGEAMARIHVEVDDSCALSETIADGCAASAADADCRIDSETVDGVETWRNGIATGLTPLAQTRQVVASPCEAQVTRDFFEASRTYRCSATTLNAPDTSRASYILEHSTQDLLADRTLQADGSYATTTRAFLLPAREAVASCEAICKTRTATTNTGVAQAGVVGASQNDTASTDTFYHSCTSDNRCPVGNGEELVADCGCLDDFPEAVVMMQSLRLAGADLACLADTP